MYVLITFYQNEPSQHGGDMSRWRVGGGLRIHIVAWFYGYKKGSRNDYGRPMKRSLDRSIGVSPPPDLDKQIRLINAEIAANGRW